MHDNLKLCGVSVEIEGDDLVVTGGDNYNQANIATHSDHRIGMSFVIFALVGKIDITIDDISMIATSFPNFFKIIDQLGFNITK